MIELRRFPAQEFPVRTDATAVTTDVSLQTLWNRMALALTLVLFGAGIALVVKAMKAPDAPVSAPRMG
jgi:hypothetical protein